MEVGKRTVRWIGLREQAKTSRKERKEGRRKERKKNKNKNKQR